MNTFIFTISCFSSPLSLHLFLFLSFSHFLLLLNLTFSLLLKLFQPLFCFSFRSTINFSGEERSKQMRHLINNFCKVRRHNKKFHVLTRQHAMQDLAIAPSIKLLRKVSDEKIPSPKVLTQSKFINAIRAFMVA